MSKKRQHGQRPAVIAVGGERYHDSDSAATFIGFAPTTMNTWRHYKRGPKWVRFANREVRYRESDLLEYIRNRPYGDRDQSEGSPV